MLFDEPTSALDPEMIGEVLDVMDRSSPARHDHVVGDAEMGFARQVGDRVVFMDQGQIVEQNSAAESLRPPEERTHARFPVEDPAHGATMSRAASRTINCMPPATPCRGRSSIATGRCPARGAGGEHPGAALSAALMAQRLRVLEACGIGCFIDLTTPHYPPPIYSPLAWFSAGQRRVGRQPVVRHGQVDEAADAAGLQCTRRRCASTASPPRAPGCSPASTRPGNSQ